ncbi:alpha-2,8-polysialyltransferase family protein [Legionella pneumophila]|uniref:polysialyltransferase family glycosyltransferase n=1 Tax=Legionella pneumophila TaxID=446 RepID=UPI00077815AA|nr:polysialyltransferase family glycosyltransferase [Legionella pneumophila]MCW8427774.1 alpha-2,8-polysialyltransferase family protein [Legionella pneumophila]HAT6809158.1 hypothetical protein [Legionella pneumophila]HAT8670075.1 hypothetical protein [Legionella pneumophila]HAU1606019.1 hypothetical protein [Legionella pneumophila]HAU1847988.1 hypothetical protein [Legionella pneumophila]
MNKPTLISIDHINQLIPAIAAYRHNKIINKSTLKPLIILTKPHIPFNSLKISHIQALISNELNSIVLSGYSLFKHPKFITYLPVRLRAKLIRRKLKKYEFDELFFSHDISSDFWNQALMHAFPHAKRICYGDALGLVYTQTYFSRFMYQIINKNGIIPHNILARLKRKLIYPAKKYQLQAQQAILAIPCDPGRDFLTQCDFSIIPKDGLKKCVADLADCIPDFKTHMQDLIKNSPNPCYLLMLSNFTESKLTTIDNEIALYKDILSKYATVGSTVILKPHPAHNPDLFSLIINTLKENYNIEVIDQKYYHLPIELAESLVQGCEVLSVSYSSISLPYLYDKQVNHVLTQELVNKYFLIQKMSWFIESNNLYISMINALPNWKQDRELLI